MNSFSFHEKLNKEISLRKKLEESLLEKEEIIRKLELKLQESETKRAKNENENSNGYTSIEARLSSLISNLNTAILVEDENRKILLANQRFCDLFSIPVPPEDMVGMDCSGSAEQSMYLFKNPDSFIIRIEELLTKKEKRIGDILHLKDGRILKRDFIPVFLKESYLGHLWTYEDITSMVEINNKIESISRFPEESPNPILRCTPEGEILFSNKASQLVVEVLIKEDKKERDKLIQDHLYEKIGEAFKNKNIVKTQVVIKKRVFELEIVPVVSEGYINIYGTDITDVKVAENKIVLLKELLNQFDEYIQILDEEGKFIFANNLSASRFGLSSEELIGKKH